MFRTHVTGVGLEEVVSEAPGKQFHLLEVAGFITSFASWFCQL